MNIHGIEFFGKLEQIRTLLIKNPVSVAVLSETVTSHSIAHSTSIEDFKAFCPPASVTGPLKKEVCVILMVSNKLSSVTKPRNDINGSDTVQTVWVELANHNLIIGGVYRRSRPSAELEKAEFTQLSNQIMKAANSGKKVLVLGDINVDHTNPYHKKSKEAKDLLSNIEAANMRRIPSSIPTWKSYGFHKVCLCPNQLQTKIESNTKNLNEYIGSINDPKKQIQCQVRAACGCLKRQLTSVIDNAYLSLSEVADLQVLDDAISDHFPILVSLAIKLEPKEKTKTIYRRDFSKLRVSEFEDALNM